MTNYRGISLLPNAAKAYNKILFNRIRQNVDPVLRKLEAALDQVEAVLSKSTYSEEL